MPKFLQVAIGQCSDKGLKEINQDFHGVLVPKEPALTSKGVAIALADGISSSEISQLASDAAVNGFFADYYCTPDSWTVKTSVQRVLDATNSWLYAQTRNSPYRFSMDKGYVCTFTALVIKSNTAHIFHVGDTRVFHLAGDRLEQLTEDHRIWASPEKSYLQRALGMRNQLQLDYKTLTANVGDVFVLATDGVYEFAADKFMIDAIRSHGDNLDAAARAIVDEALERGSADNLTIQLVRVLQLPDQGVNELCQHLTALPFAPELRPGMLFDGYEINRQLHASHRSYLYLATDTDTNAQVVIKIPSVDQRNNSDYLERFLMEEWVARRINNAHVLRPCEQVRKRNYVYIVMEYIKGPTLTQWLLDHPKPDVETTRRIVEQIATGLQAFHRQEIVHQDLRPDNIMIDANDTVKIIDFGSTQVAGLDELSGHKEWNHILGTAQYAAPEYFLGEPGSARSDIFSLGVVAYQMLSGRLPYGTEVAKSTTRAAQRKLNYATVLDDERTIPAWVDSAIRKAVHPDPYKRYTEVSEFVYDLRHPTREFLSKTRPPLLERNPILFWKGVSLILAILLVIVSAKYRELS